MKSLPAEVAFCSTCGTTLKPGGECLGCLARAAFDDLSDELPRAFGDYEILRRNDGSHWELGRGAMGVTYCANDRVLNRRVALKVIELPEANSARERTRERFLREARSAAALRHPNVAGVFQFGVAPRGDCCYYAMELVEGETLEALIRREGPLSVKDALEVAVQVTRALIAAGREGLVHRDLKPSNIMLSRGDAGAEELSVKVIDFGLAKAISGAGNEVDLTQDGFVGTPAFASPEQFTGAAADARSDIYSLGVTLWYALTGEAPFGGRTSEEIRRQRSELPLPLEELSARKISVAVVDLLRRMLSPDPALRPASARQLLDFLEQCRERPGRWPHQAFGSNRTLAVLPLAYDSAHPETEYLSEGISEGIINTLSQVPSLTVLARSTVFRYRNADPQEVGRLLNAHLVVCGTLSQRADKIIITAELIVVATGTQAWGERFVLGSAQLGSAEELISEQIAKKLRKQLTVGEPGHFRKQNPEDVTAYRLYLRGRHQCGKRTEAGLQKAIKFFKEAIDVEPDYARAWAGLADCYTVLGCWGYEPPHDSYPKARAAAERALEIDDRLSEAHVSLAIAKKDYYWDWAGAEESYRRALQLHPGNVTARYCYAEYLGCVGRHAESIAEFERARALDPLSPIVAATLARHGYSFARQYDRAIAELKQIIRSDPDFWVAHMWLGLTYLYDGQSTEALAEFTLARQLDDNAEALAGLACAHARSGNRSEAREILIQLKELKRVRYLQSVLIALVHAALGENDDAFLWLEEAHEERAAWLSEIKVDPAFDLLRSDARFDRLLERMRLV